MCIRDRLYDASKNKSYYDVEPSHSDVLKAIRVGANNGGIGFTRNGDWNYKILVDIYPHIGYDVHEETGAKRSTSFATVHVSNKGIHIVPKGSERK